MLSSILRWIYCLDISVLLLIITILTTISAFAYRWCRNHQLFRPLIGLLLIVFVSAILVSTLLTRSEQTETLTPILIPFESYRIVLNGGNPELLRSCFMNVVLFYPAGLLSAVLCPRKWNLILQVLLIGFLFTLMSAGIEYAQYVYALGQPEVDDVIHNALGSVIGGICGCLITSSKKNSS